MGQAKNRGTREQRAEASKQAFAALPADQKYAIEYRRLPAAEKRARLNAAVAGAVVEVLTKTLLR